MSIDNLIKKIPIKDEYIIVGTSAGPDSMALLHLLINNTKKKIVCAHINHNIRKQSIEEEVYLKEYCKLNNIIFECLKINNYQEKNFENEARKKRYSFYEELLNKYHSHSLFLAHHGDDLIETVLMKIIRGSNLEGYAGIKMYSHLANYTIIRPLLSLTKKDILKYNQENNIKYYLDNTNEDTTYTRNRIRKNIVPLLKEEDPQIQLKFLKYSNTLQEYYNFIEDITIKELDKIYKKNILNIDNFNKIHPFMQKNIIFYILSKIYCNNANIIKDRHITSIISLINNNKPNSYITLPNNYLAQKCYHNLSFIKKDNLKEDCQILFKNNIIMSNIQITEVKNISSDGNDVCRLNKKDITLPLYIRNKKDGDYMYVLGLNGKKKVSDIFIENKIPKSLRHTYPLLVDAKDQILWIPNIKKSKYNVKNNEICDIILTSHKEREEYTYNNEKEK